MTTQEICIGVSGGIAAYKTAALTSQLAQAGIAVSVVMTESAQRFVGGDTFAALSGQPVATRIFESDRFPRGAHIELAERCRLLCIAPASANFLGQAAQGLADDLLSTLYLAFSGPVLVAPAMNTAMWEHPAVQRNVERLRSDGVHFVEPEEGWLSCRTVGAGRMAEPDTIRKSIQQLLSADSTTP